MKKLLVTMMKGGTGKTMLVCQLARHAHAKGLRVLVVDIDDQMNTSSCLLRGEGVQKLPFSTTQVYRDRIANIDFGDSAFTVLCSDSTIKSTITEQMMATDANGEYIGDNAVHNLNHFMQQANEHFDLCILDTPSGMDHSIVCAMACADFVLAPIEFTPECMEGITTLLSGPRSIPTIREFNPGLKFLGFLPNKVEATEKQKSIMADLIDSGSMGSFVCDDQGRLLSIPKRQALLQVQAEGISLAEFAKTNSQARSALPTVRRVFDSLLSKMMLDAAGEDHE